MIKDSKTDAIANLSSVSTLDHKFVNPLLIFTLNIKEELQRHSMDCLLLNKRCHSFKLLLPNILVDKTLRQHL